MEIDNEVLADAMKSALCVEFLSSSEELRLYATAIHNAMVWGMEVDRRNRAIRERNSR